MKKITIKDQILELIVTHPKDTITLEDVIKQMPEETNISTIKTCVSRDLKNLGYIKPLGRVGPGIHGVMVYKILERDMDKKKPEPIQKVPQELDYAQIGKAIVRNIKNLEDKIKEIAEAYSNLQTEYNKQKASSALTIKEKDKKIRELHKTIEDLRENIRQTSRKFSIGELTGQ